jgi:hypothetical protein
LVMCARGVFAVQRNFVTTTFGTPSVLRNTAADAPAGPVPTIRTSVSTGLVTPLCNQTANAARTGARAAPDPPKVSRR